MRARSLLVPSALLILFTMNANPDAARAAEPPAAPAVPLPDTGLFAPVARFYRARTDRLLKTERQPVTAARLLLLLATGRSDEAARLAPRASGDPRDLAVARAKVDLARQDFAAAAPAIAALPQGADARDDERAVRYAWLVARDDAATVDSLTRPRVSAGDDARHVPDLLAAARLAYEMLDYPRSESLYTRARDAITLPSDAPVWGSPEQANHALALAGIARCQQKARNWDGSLATLRAALDDDGSPGVLMALTETLVRLGRTDEAISAAEWAVRLAPYNDAAHYWLGNGYARKNYTQLFAAYPNAFADDAGKKAIAAADAQLAAGRRASARNAYDALARRHAGWADARVHLASLDFEDGRFAEARDGCFAALRVCPEYGRAHAILAKSLEAQRFEVDVHRADYEARFAAAPMPQIAGIDSFVVNWKSLSPRHQKRVALSVAPWANFIPVLVAGGSTYFIKPMYMLLSECPDLETLRDTRIDYDSRLWDDVRGCGGYHTVTGIEDVERTIFDRYNTVLHELTHQVHGVLPPDDARQIQELYRQAKARDDRTHQGFLSRYAGGSVYEYFAEGANALESPMRDGYDPREIVKERLDRIDPELHRLVEHFFLRTDVRASYPIAYASGGDDRVGRGDVKDAVPLYQKALLYDPYNETALVSLANALVLGNRAAEAETIAARAVVGHPTSGPARVALADAGWHVGRPLDEVEGGLEVGRPKVREEDRHLVDLEIGQVAWARGDAPRALAAFDSVLAYQSDNPGGLRGRASALAIAGRWDEAFHQYDAAVRMRTGVADLRCDYARDLLRAGRVAEARAQLEAAKLLDEENPTAEALRGLADLVDGRYTDGRRHAEQALEWGPWCDLARIVLGGIEKRDGHPDAAGKAWAPVLERIASGKPPEYVFRPKLSTWEEIHVLSAVERGLLESLRGAPKR